jgi:iron complex outermembrane receptor protein
MLKTFMARSTLVALVCSVTLTAHAMADAPKHIDVPAGELVVALETLSRQAAVDLVFQPEQLKSFRTEGVSGTYSPEDAIRILLRGTPLQLRTDASSGAMVIAPPAAPKASSSLSLTGRGTEGEGSASAGDSPNSFWSRLRLAQTDTPSTSQVDTQNPSPSKGEGQGEDEKPAQRQKVLELEEIVVTGSHIRGNTGPAGSRVMVIGREEIEKSGYGSIPEVLKSLPQDFGGGASEDNNTGRNSSGNFNRGVAANLRGLGPSGTLVLVDGQRLPGSGTNGSFTDISSIPIVAIDRIEVLADGASAIYGSDAIGGVVNFIMRRDYDGAETHLMAGSAGGAANQLQASQLFGKSWASGNALVGYQYSGRDKLLYSDRAYTASDDLRPFGGDDFRTTNSNPANILDPNTFQPAFAVPANYNGALTPGDLLPGVVNYQSLAAGNAQFLPKQETHNFFLSGSQRLNDRASLFVQGLYSLRHTDSTQSPGGLVLTVPTSNTFYVDAFGDGSDLNVAYGFLGDFGPQISHGRTENYGSALGLYVALGNAWGTTLSGSYAREDLHWRANTINFDELFASLQDTNPSTAFNPFCGATTCNSLAVIGAISDSILIRSTSRSPAAHLTFDGPLLALPGGSMKLAIGADLRQESLDESELSSTSTSGFDLTRHVTAGFAELSVPLVGPNNRLAAVRSLELSLAGRFEHYSDFGSTSNPKFGLTWGPVDELKVRGTWGTSFRAPNLVELSPSRNNSFDLFLPFPDPQSPTGSSNVLARFGNNADLNRETARVWTLGLDFSPANAPNAQLSLAYYNIDYKDQIAPGGPVGNPFGVLFAEDQWQQIVTRGPSRAQIDAICNGPLFFGTVTDCLSTPPDTVAAIVDLRLRNLAAVRTTGLDLQAVQSFMTIHGAYQVALNGNYVFSFKQAVSATSPALDIVNTVGEPPKVRLRGSLSWTNRGFNISTSVNYTGSYEDAVSIPDRSVSSWTTFDAQLGYRTPSGAWLGDLELAVSATNVFDKNPPFVNVAYSGYDTANADLLGRIVSGQITKRW